MPRNKSHGQPYNQSVQHNEHHQVLGELKSIDRAVAKIVTLVDGLDQKIDALTPTVKRATLTNPLPRTSEARSPIVILDADEHNYYARLHNRLAQHGDYILMPLRDHSNRLVSSFPRTLARLAFIYEDGELFEMLKCFRIKHTTFTAHQAFCDFVGVNFAFALHAMNTYTFQLTPTVAETRELRERLRAAALRYAVPPTRESPRSIGNLNAHARAENAEALFKLLPLRDTWSLVVPSFPTDLFELFNPVYQMDVRFLLREYGQSDAPEGCERRWVEFVGVKWAWREYWVEDELVFHRYTTV